MNKSIAKIELIAECSFIVVWLTICLFTLIFSAAISLENLPKQFTIQTHIIYGLIIFLYIFILINMSVNFIKTQDLYQNINNNSGTNKTLKLILFTIAVLFIFFWLGCIFTILTGFTFFAISYEKTLDESFIPILEYFVITFGGTFILINALPALRILLIKEKLSIPSIIYLACSTLIILCFITLIILNLLHIL